MQLFALNRGFTADFQSKLYPCFVLKLARNVRKATFSTAAEAETANHPKPGWTVARRVVTVASLALDRKSRREVGPKRET